MTEPQPAPRLQVLDGVRFIAALAVVLYHYSAQGSSTTGVYVDWMAAVGQYGYLGVDLFFVVSGFVILMSAQGRTPREFVISRFIRIAPTFLLACTLTFGLVRTFGPPDLWKPISAYLVNMSLLVITPIGTILNLPQSDGVSWTLAVETQFYVFVWLALLAGALKHTRTLLWLWLGASLVFQAALTATGGNSILKLAGEAIIYDWSSYFIAGGFFYLALAGIRKRTDLLALAGCFCLSVWQSIERSQAYTLNPGVDPTPLGVAIVIALIYGTFAVIALGKWSGQGPKWLSSLGGTTYPLYLIHGALGLVVLREMKGTMPDWLLIVLTAAVFTTLALVMHHRFEKVISRWLKRKLA